MEKVEKSARVSAIRSYLKGIGLEVTNVQAHEVLACALGLKNKHVLAAKGRKKKGASAETKLVMGETGMTVALGAATVVVLPVGGHPLCPRRLEELDWNVDVIIPVPLAHMGDIEVLNNYASWCTTGSEVALEGISYEHVPQVTYERGYVAQRVTGHISTPEDHFDVSSESEDRFYQNLGTFSSLLQPGSQVRLERNGQEQLCRVGFVDSALLALFDQYVSSQGENNEEVNQVGDKVAAILQPLGLPAAEPICLQLSELKYTYLVSSHSFQLCALNATYILDFAV